MFRKAMLLAAVVGLFAVPMRAQNHKAWTPLNTVLAVTSTGLQLADCSQTITIARSKYYQETNFLLPRKPTVGRVLASCAVAITTNALLAKVLPNPWRNVSLAVVTLIEADAVLSNARPGLGIGLSLPF